MTLWVFGDSFDGNTKWADIIGNTLNTNVNNLSLSGTALEFTYQRFNYVRKKINNSDVVIICLTDFDRRWFFKEYPEWAKFDTSPTGNKKENKAIELFRKYLDHKEIHQTYLIDFLYNLYSITDEKNLHTIILSNHDNVESFINDNKHLFPAFNIAQGKLLDLNNEVINQIIENINNKTPILLGN